MKTAAFSAAELRFGGWIPRAPDLSDFYAKGRGGLQPGASRDCRPPLGAARKPTTPLGVSHVKVRKPTTSLGLLHGEARKPTAPPGVRHGEAGKTTAPPGLLRGEARKPTAPPGLLRGEARKPTMPLGLLHGEARKPTCPLGLLHGEARKPTTPQDFAPAKCKSRLRRSSFPGPGFWPPGRARRRGERRASL